MRHISLFSLTLLPVGLLSWHGANRLDLTTSQAATLDTTEPSSRYQSEETSKETGELAESPALLPSIGQSADLLSQPSFSIGRGAIAAEGAAQGSMSPSAALSPVDTKSLGTKIETPIAQPFSISLDRDQLKAVVNRAVGDRSPALGTAAATAEALPTLQASAPQPSTPQASAPQPSVQYAFYTQPAGSPASSESPANVGAQPAAQFTQTPAATASTTASNQALAAAIVHQALTSDRTADGTANRTADGAIEDAAPAAVSLSRQAQNSAPQNNPAQNIAQVPSLDPATPSGLQMLPPPTAEPPAGNALPPRTGPANTGPATENPVNTGPLSPGLFNAGGISSRPRRPVLRDFVAQ